MFIWRVPAASLGSRIAQIAQISTNFSWGCGEMAGGWVKGLDSDQRIDERRGCPKSISKL